MTKTAAQGLKVAGGVVAAAVAWTLAHFHIDITPKDEMGTAIYTLVVYVITSVFHLNLNGKTTGPTAAAPPSGPSRFAPVLLALLLMPNAARAQRAEVGFDAVMRTDSVTEPQRVRAGLLVGTRATVEYTAAVARSSEGYFEATASLGVTLSVVPGSTNRAGAYVGVALPYHYEGGPAQLGLDEEVGMRTPALGGTARLAMFSTQWLKTKRLPGPTAMGARAGLSFYF